MIRNGNDSNRQCLICKKHNVKHPLISWQLAEIYNGFLVAKDFCIYLTLGLFDYLSSPLRVEVVCHLTTWLPGQVVVNYQDLILKHHGSPPMANRWPHWGDLTPLQRCSKCILYPQPTGCISWRGFNCRALGSEENPFISLFQSPL